MDKKRKPLSLKEKVDICNLIKKGVKQSEVCKQINRSKSTVGTIWNKREEILKQFNEKDSNIMRVKKPEKPTLDQCLFKWFAQHREKGVQLTNALLIEKANEFGKELYNNDFKCSPSWIERFKKRYNIVIKKIVGESSSVDLNVVNKWLQNIWPTMKENYGDNDIFNGDETGLFYKLKSNKTLCYKNEKCSGGKLSKERVTVFVAANLSGSEKRKLTVIGKSKNPRCFQNCKKLPVSYYANTKAWMTSEIFIKILRDWDCELRKKNRKILLLVDNCAAHPKVKDLEFIRLEFLPPNTTCELQPMDQGVIHSLKAKYRHTLLSKEIKALDNNLEFKITLLDAINFLNMAWTNVTSETIANCFRHSGLVDGSEYPLEDDDDLPLSLWIQRQNNSDNTNEIDDVIDAMFDEYVHIDDNVQARAFLTTSQILESVNDDSSDESSSDEDEPALSVPTFLEATKHAEELRNYLQAQDVPCDIIDKMAAVEFYLIKKHLALTKQAKITKYFEANNC